ncbi:MAG: hypothetical protein IT578_03485 [Verrucomicrobiae bacterium]|nr:hypothetical protein [Verrucomicrobiae bacterium]
MLVGGLALPAVHADDALRVKPKTSLALKRKFVSELPADRELEVRIGPRVTETAGSFRLGSQAIASAVGRTPKDTVDLRRDLGLDDVNVGAQLDVDWQFTKNWHLALGYKYDQTSKTTTLPTDISFAGSAFAKGTSFKSEAELHQVDYVVGYDLYKDKTFKVMPFFGGKSLVAEIKGTGTSFALANPAAPGVPASYPSSSFSKNDTAWTATWLAGFDAKINISRSWYVGLTPAASALSDWWAIQGQLYTGYNFSKEWGVRLGFDSLYGKYSGSNNQMAEAALGSVFAQAVWGF